MSFNPNKLVMNRYGYITLAHPRLSYHMMCSRVAIINSLTLCGSYLASNKEVRSMLEFCAKHNIVAQTEELEMTPANANRALAKVEDNSARFRMVLVNPTTPATTATA
jgi:D-arabinose 1-dehydrogenase-like Zn-dependent alcohol dehydrogenase